MDTDNSPSFSQERPYQQCTKTVMDTIADPDITFDENGVCNYYYSYKEIAKRTVVKGNAGKTKFESEVKRIREKGIGKRYDCVLGVSGGVDSSYLAYLTKKTGLRPLVVHFDNGWNTELAVKNIENIVKKLELDLYTYVMDWEEFKDLQRAYFKASVIDVEIPTDQLIFGALVKLARKYNVSYILSGWNTVTEGIMPSAWFYEKKFDSINLLDIHEKYGNKKIKNLPIMGFWNSMRNLFLKKIEVVSLLNYIDYEKAEIKKFLIQQLDWQDYGGKHHESVFTRFYQGYYLPNKFKVDKRKAHLSTLICSGQITRRDALDELKMPTYNIKLQHEDLEYVTKKLDFTMAEFKEIMDTPPKSHYDFKTDEKLWNRYFAIIKSFKSVKNLFDRRSIFFGNSKSEKS